MTGIAAAPPGQVPAGGEGQRAGFVTRLAAFAVDAAVLSSVLAVTAWMLEVTARGLRQFTPPRIDLVSLWAAALPLLVALYHVVFWTILGQTPGKWLLGIRVARVDGRPLTVGRALLRWFGYLLSAIPLYLGFLWVLGPRRRAWHDYLARTEVVHVPEHVAEESLGATLRRRWSRSRPRVV